MLEENEHKRTMDGIEALLKDIERDLAKRGELRDEDKAAIEGLLRACEEEKARLAKQ